MATVLGMRSKNHPQQVASDDVDDRGTTLEVFQPLDEEFGFTIDVAAAAHNAKCRRYFDLETNGLEQSWAGHRVWCNPPYSDIRPWVEKAHWEADRAQVIVMLLPANRTEQPWWQDLVEPFRDGRGDLEVRFLRGRMRFLRKGEAHVRPNSRPPFGSCLVIFHGGHTSLLQQILRGDT